MQPPAAEIGRCTSFLGTLRGVFQPSQPRSELETCTCSQLGWGGALGAIALCAVGMCYSGVLFARLATAFPRTMVFDEFGRAAFGKNGQRLVYVTIYACILIT